MLKLTRKQRQLQNLKIAYELLGILAVMIGWIFVFSILFPPVQPVKLGPPGIELTKGDEK